MSRASDTTVGRHALVAAALAFLVVLSGCAALQGATSFAASPAGVCDEALSATDSELAESGWQNVSRTVEAAGVSQEVSISNHLRTYRLRAENGSTAAGFGVLSTPRGSVLGQSVNPLAGLPPDRLVTELAARFGRYGDLREIERTGEYTRTTLGTETTVAVFRANGTANDGGTARVTVHVTKVSHGGDIVIAGGVYETGESDRRDHVARLAGCLTHDVATPSDGPATDPSGADGAETPTATAVDLRAGEIPPGVTRSGLANGSRLLAAHRANRPSAPYRVSLTPVGPGFEGIDRVRVVYGSDRLSARVSGEEGTTTYWAAPEGGIHRRAPEGRVTHARARTPVGAEFAALTDRASAGVQPYVRAGTFETDGAVTAGGDRLVRLRLTGVDAATVADSPSTVAGGNGTVEEATGTMLVTPEGVIRQAQFTVTTDTDRQGSVTDRFEYRVAPAGSDALARPDWVGSAPRVRATYANGSVLALETRGPGAIAEGTELTVLAEGERLGTVTVPRRVPDGEVLYLTGGWETHKSAATLRASVGERPTPPTDSVNFRVFSALSVTGEGPRGGFQVTVTDPEQGPGS